MDLSWAGDRNASPTGVEPHDRVRQGIASTRRSFSGDHVKLLATSGATYKGNTPWSAATIFAKAYPKGQ